MNEGHIRLLIFQRNAALTETSDCACKAHVCMYQLCLESASNAGDWVMRHQMGRAWFFRCLRSLGMEILPTDCVDRGSCGLRNTETDLIMWSCSMDGASIWSQVPEKILNAATSVSAAIEREMLFKPLITSHSGSQHLWPLASPSERVLPHLHPLTLNQKVKHVYQDLKLDSLNTQVLGIANS